ncbi:MAG: LptF/LptG family permease [Bacteroidota bacterium]
MKIYPNKLQLNILLRHVGPFLFCFLTVMFLLLMQFLILQIDRLIGKDIPFPVIVELILTNLAYMVVLAAPMAMLVSTLMAFGKFSELNELTALRASGVNPFFAMAPVLIASLLLSIFLGWFSNSVLPEANHKARSLFIDIRIKKPGFELKPDIFYNGIEGYTFLVEYIDGKTDTLYNITLFQEPNSSRDRAYIKAEKGFLSSTSQSALLLTLFDGNITRYIPTYGNDTETIERNEFGRHQMNMDISDLSFSRSDPSKRNRSDRTMSAQAMLAVVDSLELEIEDQYRQLNGDPLILPAILAQNPEEILNFQSFDLAPDTNDALLTTMVTLNALSSRNKQLDAINEAKRELKNYESRMENTVSSINWRVKRISKYWVEVHKKFSIPIAAFIFALMGAPLGMMTKKGNFGYAAIISTVILTVYWVAIIQGEKLADRLFITPFTGMWFINILYFVIGLMLTLQLTTNLNMVRLFRKK